MDRHICPDQLTANGKSVEVTVADKGPGIPADEKALIFDAFFRGSRAMQDQVHGTGLGLNLVKSIVEAHGGSVSVTSDTAGTRFIIRIPACLQSDVYTGVQA